MKAKFRILWKADSENDNGTSIFKLYPPECTLLYTTCIQNTEIIVQAELMELSACRTRLPDGVVVEAKIDRGQGPVATLIVKRGTLRPGACILILLLDRFCSENKLSLYYFMDLEVIIRMV